MKEIDNVRDGRAKAALVALEKRVAALEAASKKPAAKAASKEG